MASSANRARYWARSFAGWHEFGHIKPNAAHEGLSRLQALSWVDNILTQNVDRLHHKAGSSAVLELHGTTHRCVHQSHAHAPWWLLCSSCAGLYVEVLQ